MLGLHPVIHVPNYMDHYSFTDPWFLLVAAITATIAVLLAVMSFTLLICSESIGWSKISIGVDTGSSR